MYRYEGDDDGDVDTARWKKLEQTKTTGGQILYSSNWTYNDNEQKNHIDFSKASLEETPSVGTFPWDYTYDKDKADQLKTAQRKQVWAGGSSVLNTYDYTLTASATAPTGTTPPTRPTSTRRTPTPPMPTSTTTCAAT